MAPNAAIFSLYRRHLRQIRQLPHIYLRAFFRIKVTDDVRAILSARNFNERRKKIKRVSKDLFRAQAAAHGSKNAFTHALDLAYGRTGKLRWEIMKPLLSDLNSPMPLRIIPTEEKSRPPVYSPELAALLTSAHSRKTKLLDKSSLITPPTLPKRADRLSAEARLLGRLSKRREVKIRWRYFTTEWKKVLPPLQVAVREKSRSKELCRETSEIRAVTRAGIRNIGMQGSGVLEDVQSLVGLPWTDRIPTRREIRARDQNINLLSVPRQPMTRWLRRRYQELLGRLPILVYSYFEQEGDHTFGKFEVSQHPSAITPSKRHNITRLAEVDDVGLTWIQQVDKKNKGTRL